MVARGHVRMSFTCPPSRRSSDGLQKVTFRSIRRSSDMHTRDKKKILAVVDDLLFTVKINDAAKRAGVDVVFLKSERDVLDKAATEKPLMIIIDLNNNSVEPLHLIEKLKAHEDLKKISLIGYLSHVQGELKQKAHEAGANIVMARSAFSQNLQQILKRHTGVV